MQIFDRYDDLLAAIEAKGHKPNVLGRAPDGAPIVAIKSGPVLSPWLGISMSAPPSSSAMAASTCWWATPPSSAA